MDAIEEELGGCPRCFLAGSMLILQIHIFKAYHQECFPHMGRHMQTGSEICLQETSIVCTSHEARNSRHVLCEDALKECIEC